MSFQDLSREQLAALNVQAQSQVTSKIVTLFLQDIIGLLGLRECLPDETPHFVHKQVRYVMENSRTNRPIDIAAAKALAELWKAGRFVFNGEPAIVDDNGQIASFQHRGWGYWAFCTETGLDPGYPVVLVEGVPHEFGDTIDTGRSRSQKDIFARNPEVLSIESLHDINGESFGDRSPAIRKTLLGEVTTACNFIRLRASGKNVQTGGQAARAVLHRVYRAFGDYGSNQLDQLVNLVYSTDLGQGDKPTWSKAVGRPVIVAGLALWSLRESNRWDSTSDWEGSINIEDATRFCSALSQSWVSADGPLSEFFAELRKAKGQKMNSEGVLEKSGTRAELKREFVFGALVRAIQEFLGEVELSGGYIPKAKKGAKAYPAFGGVDCGYIAPQRGRKAEDSEESDDSEE
jgi:hypothetical protein